MTTVLDDLDIGSLFPEPERPPSPEPTITTYSRSKARAIAQTSSSSTETPHWETISIRLVGSHPLWAHHLWNAARSFASYLDENASSLCFGKNVLELGAGGALPGLVAALSGANKVVLTDYPDADLLENISINVSANIPESIRSKVSVQGYTWGRDTSELLNALSNETTPPKTAARFDLLILSDLVFNHAMHGALLDTCEKTLVECRPEVHSSSGSSLTTNTTTPVVLVFYTHHRPRFAQRDLGFFEMAQKRGWICEEFHTERIEAMFPNDPGDVEVRSTVHGWRMYRGIVSPDQKSL